MSPVPLVSPAARLLARDANTTYRPSALSRGMKLPSLAWSPPGPTLTRTVVFAPRSRMKTSCTALVSPATRVLASEPNTTDRPSAEIPIGPVAAERRLPPPAVPLRPVRGHAHPRGGPRLPVPHKDVPLAVGVPRHQGIGIRLERHVQAIRAEGRPQAGAVAAGPREGQAQQLGVDRRTHRGRGQGAVVPRDRVGL